MSLFDDDFFGDEQLKLPDVEKPISAKQDGELPFFDEQYDAQALWNLCLERFKGAMSEMDFNQWLRPITPTMQGNVLTLMAINAVYIERVNRDYLPVIEQVLSEHTSGKVVLKTQVKSRTPVPKQKKSLAKKTVSVEGGNTLNRLYTFENFVKGKSNALAYNACLELSKRLGKGGQGGILDSHLLFVYGASGLGKTHLISAVAHRYQKAGLSYCFFDKDSFFKVATTALRMEKNETGHVERLMESISQADLLIVDDVHMINSKSGPTVTGLLMGLFGEFTQGTKRLILASDRPPSRMANFDERFLSRFSGGLSLPIEPPDMDTRIQILQKKAMVKQMVLPNDCAVFIAQNIPFDVRGLEGALDQVLAYALTTGASVELGLVRQALKDRVQVHVSALSADGIRDVVSKYYHVTVNEMMGKGRSRRVARPRQMAMALIRELTQDSLTEIGQAFGGRDHTTVMHACETIAELRQTQMQIDKDYQALMATLRAG
ncbi:MAG: chromosomal replication initiator protein DnaA [Moraxella sp.]|nr:chromosomal replication initiator protein DnaA [Moraxella sp.]